MNVRLKRLINQVAPPKSDCFPLREIRLDNEQAVRWLNHLEQRFPFEEPGSSLAQFYEDLSDACRLADWKREDVRLDVEQTSIPELVIRLSSESSEFDGNIDPIVVHEMVSALVGTA